jgi:GxxExxY protein
LPRKTQKGTKVKWENINPLCDIVRETSFAIHQYHRHGHLEKVYENALLNRLRKHGLEVERQYPLTVYDEDGSVLGE